MKYRTIILIMILFLIAFNLSGCSEKMSSLSVVEISTDHLPPELSEIPEPTDLTVVVNISSKTIHTHATCRFVQNAQSENLRYLNVKDDTLGILQSMEYSFCSACRYLN